MFVLYFPFMFWYTIGGETIQIFRIVEGEMNEKATAEYFSIVQREGALKEN